MQVSFVKSQKHWVFRSSVLVLAVFLVGCSLPSKVKKGRRVEYEPSYLSSTEEISSDQVNKRVSKITWHQDDLYKRRVQQCYPAVMRALDADISQTIQSIAIGFYHDAYRQMDVIQAKQKWLSENIKGYDLKKRCPPSNNAYGLLGKSYG